MKKGESRKQFSNVQRLCAAYRLKVAYEEFEKEWIAQNGKKRNCRKVFLKKINYVNSRMTEFMNGNICDDAMYSLAGSLDMSVDEFADASIHSQWQVLKYSMKNDMKCKITIICALIMFFLFAFAMINRRSIVFSLAIVSVAVILLYIINSLNVSLYNFAPKAESLDGIVIDECKQRKNRIVDILVSALFIISIAYLLFTLISVTIVINKGIPVISLI